MIEKDDWDKLVQYLSEVGSSRARGVFKELNIHNLTDPSYLADIIYEAISISGNPSVIRSLDVFSQEKKRRILKELLYTVKTRSNKNALRTMILNGYLAIFWYKVKYDPRWIREIVPDNEILLAAVADGDFVEIADQIERRGVEVVSYLLSQDLDHTQSDTVVRAITQALSHYWDPTPLLDLRFSEDFLHYLLAELARWS
jgi:hypothetical protein